MCGQTLTTYLGLLFADAYMRSLWEGGGDGRGVTLFEWKDKKEEDEEKKGGGGGGTVREIVEKRSIEVNHSPTFIQYVCVFNETTMMLNIKSFSHVRYIKIDYEGNESQLTKCLNI